MALIFEAIVGYPAALHARVPHPVVGIGYLINRLEALWNQPRHTQRLRRLLGCVTVLAVAGLSLAVGLIIETLASRCSFGWLLVAGVGTIGLAQRSLYQHVRDVRFALEARDLALARRRVALIVGRDTASLDDSGVAAAALESLAESFNDGVLAPAFWFCVGGLPGLFVYKTLNTADSLIGHREERWRSFGWAAARADDVANLVPARLAGSLLALAGCGGFNVMLRDASNHASPNAGWPEAAMAGALRIQLGGPATYEGVLHERPTFGNGRRATPDDLARGLRIYVRACGLLWLILLLLVFGLA